MGDVADPAKALIDRIDAEHRGRGRTLSELANKLIVQRKKTLSGIQFEQWLQDMDIMKRCAEHVGACQALTEVRAALLPEVPK